MAPASRTSERGLDWFAFFVADIQTGFGPYLAVYLTTQKWNQADIGLVLAFGSIIGLLSQIPGGWLVDRAQSKLRAAAVAVIGVGISALLIAVLPTYLGMLAATLLHVASSAVLGPAIAAISLGLVGHAAIGPRLGRNTRFAAIGNGLAAAAMGAIGYLNSPQAVFFATAALALPTIWALTRIRNSEIDPGRADGLDYMARADARAGSVLDLLRKRALAVFALCIFLFQAANAAMLPLVGSEMTLRSSQWASVLIAACIVVPQLVAAAIAPSVGRLAASIGRRPILLAGFAVLPLRAILLTVNRDPASIIAVQALDGISGAALGVLVPLVLADISRGTGRFNLAQGILACATGIGAAASTAVAGYLAARFGTAVACLGLAAAAVCAFLTVLIAMEETMPRGRARREPK
ncbi:MAG TPA: MFS transporter [Hyphomicrobiaceae bacterium]|nr:MFS transporter [Hyphomicrobiaceae bacterium]